MSDDWHNFGRALTILSDLYRRWILLDLARRASSSSFIPSAIAAGLSPKSRFNLFLFFGFGRVHSCSIFLCASMFASPVSLFLRLLTDRWLLRKLASIL